MHIYCIYHKFIIVCQKLTNDMKTTFGEYIRLLRTTNGMTLTQLASKLDLDIANLSKIENNKRDFDVKRLRKLASEFSLSYDIVKFEYFSYQIAKKVYENNCSMEILLAAEEKVNYLRNNKDARRKIILIDNE